MARISLEIVKMKTVTEVARRSCFLLLTFENLEIPAIDSDSRPPDAHSHRKDPIAGFVGAACAASTTLKAPRDNVGSRDGDTSVVYTLIVNGLLRLSAFLRWTRTG